MKQFKRTISILLAVAMLATVLCTGMAFTAMAEDNTPGAVVTDEAGFNLIKNPGFENHDSELQDWGAGNVTLNTDAAYVHSGICSAKISAATPAESFAYNVVTTDNIMHDVNGVLKVGMWVYLTNAEDASKVTVYIERPESDGNRSVQPEAKNGWQKVMLTTDGVSGCIRNAIKISVAPDTAGDVYFDDAFVIPVDMESIELLYNNGFERGDGWGGETAYVTENVRSGAYAMKLSAGADLFQSLNWHWYGKQMTTGRTLRYSFWVKGGSDDSKIWINAEVKYGDGQVVNCSSNAVTGYADNWTLISVDAPAPDGAISEIILHIITEGSGDYFVDDGSLRTVADASAENRNPGMVVTGITGINLVDNAGFEDNGNNWGMNAEINTDTAYTHSGAVSAKVAAGQTGEGYAYSIPTATYNRDSALKAGMWVYLTNAGDASKVTIVMERNSEDGTVTAKPEAKAGWQRVEMDVPATSGANHHAIKFTVSAGNVADIYFDDAFIYCLDAESINILRNGSFENNKDAWADVAGFQIVSNVSRSGAAAQLTGETSIFQASGWWPNKASVNSGDTLYYSAWVKGGENAGSIVLRAEVKCGGTEDYYSQTVSGETDGWKLLTVAIPYNDLDITEILFHINTSGEGVFYVDDVKVNSVKPVIAKWQGYSMALGDSLDMRFHVSVLDGMQEDVSLKISVAGETVVYTAANVAKNDNAYIFSIQLAAAQMTDLVTAELWAGGELVHSGSYTIAGYAAELLAQMQDEDLTNLINAMLNYGGKAQTYFDYNTENLAGANVSDAVIPSAEGYDCQVQGNVAGIRFYGATLLFRSKTVIRYYFVADNGIAGCSVEVDGVNAQWNEKDGMYYVEVTVENPAVLDELHTVTLKSGEDAMAVTYSGMHYVARMYNKAEASQELKELVQAMYNYHETAQAYQK